MEKEKPEDKMITINLHGKIRLPANAIWTEGDVPENPTAKDAALILEKKDTHLNAIIKNLSFCDIVLCTVSTANKDIAPLNISQMRSQ